ncbi:hypothetical protein EOL94_04530 [bacterium]|nr:hypothetical protein [bacterium]
MKDINSNKKNKYQNKFVIFIIALTLILFFGAITKASADTNFNLEVFTKTSSSTTDRFDFSTVINSNDVDLIICSVDTNKFSSIKYGVDNSMINMVEYGSGISQGLTNLRLFYIENPVSNGHIDFTYSGTWATNRTECYIFNSNYIDFSNNGGGIGQFSYQVNNDWKTEYSFTATPNFESSLYITRNISYNTGTTFSLGENQISIYDFTDTRHRFADYLLNEDNVNDIFSYTSSGNIGGIDFVVLELKINSSSSSSEYEDYRDFESYIFLYDIYNVNINTTSKLDYVYSNLMIEETTNEIKMWEDYDIITDTYSNLIATSTIEDLSAYSYKRNGLSYLTYTSSSISGLKVKVLSIEDNDGNIYNTSLNVYENDFDLEIIDLGNSDYWNSTTSTSKNLEILNEYFDTNSMACNAEKWASDNAFTLAFCGTKKFVLDCAFKPIIFLNNSIATIKDKLLNSFPFGFINIIKDKWEEAEITLNDLFFIKEARAEIIDENLLNIIPEKNEGFEFTIENFSGEQDLSFKIFNLEEMEAVFGSENMLMLRSLMNLILYVLFFTYLFIRLKNLIV